MTGVLTGFPNLDSLIGGCQPADLLLLASPQVTKNISLALSIVLKVAGNGHHRVGMFTPVVNKQQMVQRLLALSAGIDLHSVRTGVMTDDDRNQLTESAKTLSRTQIWIDDRADLSVLQLQQRAQIMIKAHDIAFLFVDNIHCLRGWISIQKSQDQILGKGEASKMLKQLATALRIPVLVSAPYKVPQKKKDISNATSIHKNPHFQKRDIDHVLFLYRENVSELAVQDKSCLIIPLLASNSHKGFVIDIEPSSRQRITFADEVYTSRPISQEEVASYVPRASNA